MKSENRKWYLNGLREGIPIGLGYFAVGFTLGIAAREAGITAFQMGLMSLMLHASAGQYAVITVIAGQSGYFTMMVTQLVINIRPYYNYGAVSVASPLWAVGTVLGVLVGNILPASLTSALSVALYAMFLAVVIPASKSDRTVAAVVAASMAGSSLFTFLPVLAGMDSGTRIIVLTVAIAAAAAVIRPVPADKEVQQ